ncbi:rod-binding protein [Sulfurimonas sp. MAG313]|nr:rod-binding protein [Sulfurimonas sp. MAG313]MDF1879981.1 rod-binding protein [Sulfurimonas sp. MAG313]
MNIDTSNALFSAKQDIPKIKDGLDSVALKEQTDQFEAIILKQLLDTSMKDENTLFGKDPGDKIYNSMYRDEISKVGAGSMGISQMLFDFLSDGR